MKHQSNTKPKTKKLIIIEILIATLLILTSLFITINNKKTNIEKTSDKNTNDKKTGQNDIEKKKIKFKKYTFTIPNNVKSEIKDTECILKSQDKEWQATLIIDKIKYEEVINSKNNFKETFNEQYKNLGYDMTNSEVEIVNKEKELLIIKNVKTSSDNIDIIYCKADDESVFVVSLVNNENNDDYRNIIYSIIESAKTV